MRDMQNPCTLNLHGGNGGAHERGAFKHRTNDSIRAHERLLDGDGLLNEPGEHVDDLLRGGDRDGRIGAMAVAHSVKRDARAREDAILVAAAAQAPAGGGAGLGIVAPHADRVVLAGRGVRVERVRERGDGRRRRRDGDGRGPSRGARSLSRRGGSGWRGARGQRRDARERWVELSHEWHGGRRCCEASV